MRCHGEGSVAPKEQGRRRSMPSTTLPAPDIEIGLRHPVCLKMHRNYAGTCDLSHNLARKFRSPTPGLRLPGIAG